MKRLRKLSDVEASFALMNALLAGNTQVTTLVTLDGEFDPRQVETSVHRLIDLFPFLGTRIVEDAGILWFFESADRSGIEITHRRLRTGQSPHDLLRLELNDVLPTGGLLWRMRVVMDPGTDQTHFYFTRNHAISDGFSTTKLWGVFLRLINGAAMPQDAIQVRIAPNADALTYRPPEEPAMVEELREAERQTTLPYCVDVPVDERRAEFVSIPFSVAETDEVRAFCKRHGVTVNQFFTAALARGFSQSTGTAETNMFTAVSLRKRYVENEFLSDIGCFINVINPHLPIHDAPLLQVAAYYQTAFCRQDALWRPLGRDHTAIRAAVEEMGQRGYFPGICITNLGVLDIPLQPYLPLVKEFRTVVNRVGANYGVVLHLSMVGGAFTASLAYGSPCMSPSIAEATVAEILRDVKQAQLVST